MPDSYKALPLHPMNHLLPYLRPSQRLPANVTMDSPAILVMTDLSLITAVTVEPNVSIAWALRHMKENGVRLLLVTNYRSEIFGLITSTDIEGEKPLQVLQEIGGRREELRVRDLMTPYEQLDVLKIDDVLRASVGDIVATLQSVGRRHAVVIGDESENGMPALRGIFSATQISRQLGILFEPMEIARNFAELEGVLTHS